VAFKCGWCLHDDSGLEKTQMSTDSWKIPILFFSDVRFIKGELYVWFINGEPYVQFSKGVPTPL